MVPFSVGRRSVSAGKRCFSEREERVFVGGFFFRRVQQRKREGAFVWFFLERVWSLREEKVAGTGVLGAWAASF